MGRGCDATRAKKLFANIRAAHQQSSVSTQLLRIALYNPLVPARLLGLANLVILVTSQLEHRVPSGGQTRPHQHSEHA